MKEDLGKLELIRTGGPEGGQTARSFGSLLKAGALQRGNGERKEGVGKKELRRGTKGRWDFGGMEVQFWHMVHKERDKEVRAGAARKTGSSHEGRRGFVLKKKAQESCK